VHLLDLLAEADLTGIAAEVSVKLTASGCTCPTAMPSPSSTPGRSARPRRPLARRSPSTWRTTRRPTDARHVHELREDFPWVGAVLQSYLHRTEGDCRDLATRVSRVRLCKGAYKEPESVAYQDGDEVDLSYVRCLKVLMAGEGYPMVASHDPRLIEIAAALAATTGASPKTFEYQMLYGIRMTSRSGSPTAATRCGSTSRSARSGTATSCAGWPSARPTSRSSCAHSPPTADPYSG
jgi:proline dehydrogenase